MKPETLLSSLDFLDEELLAASERPIKTYRPKPWLWAAAALALVVGLGYLGVRYVQTHRNTDPTEAPLSGQNDETAAPATSSDLNGLPLLEAGTFELQKLDEASLQVRLKQVLWPGYPSFRQRDEDLGTLPVFQRHKSSSVALTQEQMNILAVALAKRLGMTGDIQVDPEPPEWDSLAAIVEIREGVTLTVRQNGYATVEYREGCGPQPPKNFDGSTKKLKYHYLTQLSELLEVPYREADETNPGRATTESEEAFLADTLLQVEMNYRENGELQLLSFDACFADRVTPLGDYPTISFDEAWSYAKEGRFYIAAGAQDKATAERFAAILRELEPVYVEYLYSPASSGYVLPYYCFWLPDENEPNLYVPVLVPAVRWEYLTNPPVSYEDMVETVTPIETIELPTEPLLPGVVEAGTPSDSDLLLENGQTRLRIPASFRELLYCTTGYNAEGERVGLFQVYELASYEAGKTANSSWSAGRLCSVYKLHETQPALQEILSGPMNGITPLGTDADGYWYFMDTPMDLTLIRLNDNGEADQRAVTEADTQQWTQFQTWVFSILPSQFCQDNDLTAYDPAAASEARTLPILDARDAFHESMLLHAEEELEQLRMNLWRQESAYADFATLPVFEARTRTYDSSTPILDDAAMQRTLRTEAEKAGLGEIEIRPAVYNLPNNMELPEGAMEYVGQTDDDIQIGINSAGRVTIQYIQSESGRSRYDDLPAEIRAELRSDPYDAALYWLTGLRGLLDLPYAEKGELEVESTMASLAPRYASGRDTDDDKELFLGYMLRNVDLELGEDGRLLNISYDACFRERWLPVGDYPILSFEEAEALAHNGQFYTDGLTWEGYNFDWDVKNAGHGELLYIQKTPAALRIPYYRFFCEVRCPPTDPEVGEAQTVYVPVYVPAVRGEYLGFPTPWF